MQQTTIVSTPCALAGKPRINGTRLSVAFVLERLADGWSNEDVLDSYPALTLADIQAAIAYKSHTESTP